MERTNYLTLSETIYRNIKESIVNHKYKHGNRLLLKNLSNEMKVSVTPVREALKKLDKDGLVKIIPNKGAIVVKLTLKDVVEIYDIRKQLESLAMELIIKRVTKKMIDELNEICDKDDDCITKGDLKLHTKYNNRFHKLLVIFSQNKRLNKFYNELGGQLSVVISKTIDFAGEPKKSVNEHRKIVEALTKKDAELAKKIIQGHIQNAKKDILDRAKDALENKKKNINNIEIDEIV